MGLVLLVTILCGCGSRTTTNSVPITIVDKDGPGVVGGDTYQDRNLISIFAAGSYDDLKALVYGSGDGLLEYDLCDQASTTNRGCPRVPGKSLLLLVPGQTGCGIQTDITQAVVSGSTLTIGAVTRSTFCFSIGGRGTSAKDRFWLVAVPLEKLPAKLLTVVFSDEITKARNTTEVRTVADLRGPASLGGKTITARVAEVRAAIAAVKVDAASRGLGSLQLTGLAIESWSDRSLGCPHQGETYDRASSSGLVVTLGNAQEGPSREYHWAPDTIVYCGPLVK
jgi:hypothetical protein